MFNTASIVSLLLTLALSTGANAVIEEGLEPRAISAETLARLSYISQFAVAAYCDYNTNGTNKIVSCSDPGCLHNCPLLETNNIQIAHPFFHDGKRQVTGFIGIDNVNKLIVLAYRGSHGVTDSITDLESILMVPWVELIPKCVRCEVGDGFLKARQQTRVELNEALTALTTNPIYKNYEVVITGHSLGAADAAIAATELRTKEPRLSCSLYTYGQPRIGNNATSNHINASPNTGSGPFAGSYRVTHTTDPIPKVPPYIPKPHTPLCQRPPFNGPYPRTEHDWTHFSPEYHITRGDYANQIGPGDVDVWEGALNCFGNSGAGSLVFPKREEVGLACDAKAGYQNCSAHCFYFGHLAGGNFACGIKEGGEVTVIDGEL